ncbi:hypothetical protein WJ438_23575 [Streptomyces sp. GD-15H]|uniref:hypothetical protein n=1 Tax=Streptomyces sp. GD-15H TaxID=3129112 RepID=UPI00325230D2
MRLHILPTFGAGSVADVTTARVRGWRGKLLAAGVGEPTVGKAYQLLRALMNTAVDDELLRRNPCRIKGADRYDVPERPVLTVAEVFAVAASLAPRYRLLVLLAAFTTLRFGELAALRRRDVDLEGLILTVRRAQAELQDGRLFDKAPKSVAGVRAVSFPAELLDAVTRPLEQFAAPGRDGHVFVGPQGGQLRRSNFRDDWVRARNTAGVTAELHLLSRPGARCRDCSRSVSPDRSPNPPYRSLGNGLSTVSAVRQWRARGLGSCCPGRCSGRPPPSRSGRTRPHPPRSASARWRRPDGGGVVPSSSRGGLSAGGRVSRT